MTLQKQINNQDSKKENNKYKYKKHYNSNVCFLCGHEGHYGTPTSFYASKQIRKNYFN